MPTGQKASALTVIGLALLGALYTLLAGNQPLLGLDLQGGVSVVLEPTGTTDGAGPSREVTEESLDLTVELLRARIDEIGVAEPEISRQGDNIVVGLPGLVDDQEDALNRLRQTAELRFRPVIRTVDLLPDLSTEDAGSDDADGGDSTELDESDGTNDGTDDGAAEDEEGSFGAVTPVAFSTSTDDGDPGNEDTEEGDGTGDGEADDTDDGDPGVAPIPDSLLACFAGEVTPDEEDRIEDTVILTDDDGIAYCLGPAIVDGELLTGDMIETASVSLSPGQGWAVNPTFNSGPDGIDRFNRIAGICFLGNSDICPPSPDSGRGRVAIVLDHQVISAPTINAAGFARDSITISGSSINPFEEDEARRLAEALRFGSLPLELVAQETRTVSATIGSDVLRSGVIAGIIGLVLVGVYLLAYYRLAGLVAISGLVLSALLLWTIIAWLGESVGLALTLSGVVGLIVSIGVSTDSNIVYFENVKDSYRSGRRVPTAIERAYESAISTIVKADVVSLIAAVLLYLLTVGAVRGFAFYLGLATILDLIISWMFMRPALSWLAGRQAVEENPALLGLPASGGPQ
ncbi:MAG: protein translocase subunit SecD [Actinomycetota bacterium]